MPPNGDRATGSDDTAPGASDTSRSCAENPSLLSRADLADKLALSEPAARDRILGMVENEMVADVFEDLEDEIALEIASRLETTRLASIADLMERDRAADLLNDLDSERRADILDLMSTTESVLPLLEYGDDTAGGIMRLEQMPVRHDAQAGSVLQRLGRSVSFERQSANFFVIGTHDSLAGIVSIYSMLCADASTQIEQIMQRGVVKVQATDSAEQAARLVARHRLDILPVVDASDRLLGIIFAEDVAHVLEEAATEDAQRFGGSAPLRRRYLSVGPLGSAKKRIGWLALLFASGTLTAAIMGAFEATIAQAAGIAAFIPLLVGTGGNAGSQSTATIIRALTTQEIAPRDLGHVLWRELRTGVVLGVIMALGGLVVAWLSGSSLLVASAISASLLAILVFSSMVGATLPMAARMVGVDAALVSGPLLSTLVDAAGLLVYFSIARLLLS